MIDVFKFHFFVGDLIFSLYFREEFAGFNWLNQRGFEYLKHASDRISVSLAIIEGVI